MIILDLKEPSHLPILYELIKDYKPSMNPGQDGFVYIEACASKTLDIYGNQCPFMLASSLSQIPDENKKLIIFVAIEPEMVDMGTFGIVSKVRGFIYINQDSIRYVEQSDLMLKTLRHHDKFKTPFEVLEHIFIKEHELVEQITELKSDLPMVIDESHKSVSLFIRRIDGMSLHHFIDPFLSDLDHLSVGRMLRIAISACDALLSLHSRFNDPLFHRDIKPDNMMLEVNSDRVIPIDFGKAVFENKLEGNDDFGAYEYSEPTRIQQLSRMLSNPHCDRINYTRFRCESDAFSLYIILIHLFGIKIHPDDINLVKLNEFNKDIKIPDISTKIWDLTFDERSKLQELFRKNMSFHAKDRYSLQQTKKILEEVHVAYINRKKKKIADFARDRDSLPSIDEQELFQILSSDAIDYFLQLFKKDLYLLTKKIQKIIHLLPVYQLDKLKEADFDFKTLDLSVILKQKSLSINQLERLVKLGVPVGVEACEHWIQSYQNIDVGSKINWLLVLRYLYQQCQEARDRLVKDYVNNNIKDTFIRYLARWYVLIPSLSAHEFHFIYMIYLRQFITRIQLQREFNHLIQQPDFKINVAGFKSWFDNLIWLPKDDIFFNEESVNFLQKLYDFLVKLNQWKNDIENHGLIECTFSDGIEPLLTEALNLLNNIQYTEIAELNRLSEALSMTWLYQTELDDLFNTIQSIINDKIPFNHVDLLGLFNDLSGCQHVDDAVIERIHCVRRNLDTAIDCYDIYQSLDQTMPLYQRLQPHFSVFIDGLAKKLSSAVFEQDNPIIRIMHNIEEFILTLTKGSSLGPYILSRVNAILASFEDVIMPLTFLWEHVNVLYDNELILLKIKKSPVSPLIHDAAQRVFNHLLMGGTCFGEHIDINSINQILKYTEKHSQNLPIHKQVALREVIVGHISAYLKGDIAIKNLYDLLKRVEQRLISDRLGLENPPIEHRFFQSNTLIRSSSSHQLSNFRL